MSILRAVAVEKVYSTRGIETRALSNIDLTIDAGEFKSEIENYYMTDPISRNSETMARCVSEILGDDAARTGPDG